MNWGKQVLIAFRRLIPFRTLPQTSSICEFQVSCSSNTRPRSLWLSTLFIAVPLWVIWILWPCKRASLGQVEITMDSIFATFKAISWFPIHDEIGFTQLPSYWFTYSKVLPATKIFESSSNIFDQCLMPLITQWPSFMSMDIFVRYS